MYANPILLLDIVVVVAPIIAIPYIVVAVAAADVGTVTKERILVVAMLVRISSSIQDGAAEVLVPICRGSDHWKFMSGW